MIAVFGAASVAIVAASTAMAIDYANIVAVKASAQSAIDAATLNCVKRPDGCGPSLFNANFDASKVVEEKTVVSVGMAGEDRAEGQATITPKLLIGGAAAFFGIGEITVEAVAEYGPPADGVEELTVGEIVFVIDISSSMSDKLDDMKVAMKTFVTEVFKAGTPSITIMPYGSSIRFPLNVGFERYLASSTCDAEADRCAELDPPNVWNGCFKAENYDTIANGRMAINGSLKWIGDEMRPRWGVDGYLCPPKGSEALFFSTSETDILARIDSIQFGDSTGTYTALNWAYRAIKDDVSQPFRNGTPRVGERTAVVLLSDGVPGGFPQDLFDPTGSGGDSRRDKAAISMLAACDVLKAASDIDLYTMFMNSEQGDDENGAALMETCAPSVDQFWLTSPTQFLADFGEVKNRMVKASENVGQVRLTQ